MATSGIRRKVDDLGRVVIPAGIRRSLNIREGDAVEVTVEGERVVIARPRDACVFCGREEDDLQAFRGRLVCRDCLGTLGTMDERSRAIDEATIVAPLPHEAPVPAAEPEPAAAVHESPPARPRPPAPKPAPAEVRTPWERARRDEIPNGPIDGDAWAREQQAAGPARRRPPQDPASTTAW